MGCNGVEREDIWQERGVRRCSFLFAQTNRLLGEQPSGTYLEIWRGTVFSFYTLGSMEISAMTDGMQLG